MSLAQIGIAFASLAYTGYAVVHRRDSWRAGVAIGMAAFLPLMAGMSIVDVLLLPVRILISIF